MLLHDLADIVQCAPLDRLIREEINGHEPRTASLHEFGAILRPQLPEMPGEDSHIQRV